MLDEIDWNLAVGRVLNDQKTDFIWAPQFRYLLQRGVQDVVQDLGQQLVSGKFYPGVPLTIEVPKSFRVKSSSNIQHLAPNFSRPGSILPLRDRLLYQAIADHAAPLIEATTDRTRSFSHELIQPASENMFVSNRICWNRMRQKMRQLAAAKEIRFVLRLDIADYFGSLNQHTLINMLRDIGLSTPLADRLEAMLLAYSGERSSRGILQGMYPSDLLGAFYLHPIDRLFEEQGIKSVRYVDDIYIFVSSVSEADMILRKVIPELRLYDLRLNEAKCKVMVKTELFAEEPDLEDLFSEALEEVSEQLEESYDNEDYGFQTSWDHDEDDGESEEDCDGSNLELEATKRLFDATETHPGQEESIERFCLPLFSRAESDYAVDYVMESFLKQPSMGQIYCSYLAKFIRDRRDISEFLINNIQHETLYDWQKMWMLACLHQNNPTDRAAVRVANEILHDTSGHEVLRAVAATHVARRGDAARRKGLFSIYQAVSPFIQYAIYFASSNWPTAERETARSSWGAHGDLNRLYTRASSSL